jgi:hypothetical protein
MSLPFNNFNVSPSCRTPNFTNYPQNFYPHGPCLQCSNPYHNLDDCPHWGQLSNFSHEQINTNFSSLGFELNSNFYNPDWSNHYDFLWQAHAMGNYAPQSYGLHHSDYPQSNNLSFNPSSYDYPSKQSSLEETLKKFMQLIGQSTGPVSQEPSLEDTLKALIQYNRQGIQELKDATMVNSHSMYEIKDAAMANTKAIARLEGQLGQVIGEFNIVEEEEFQS